MEVAVIDWKSIDTRFVRDELFENINAPKWVDFFSIDDNPVDDEAWFCRPNCNHPKTVDDFFRDRKSPISNFKLQRSASVSDVPPLGDQNKRDATLKKRGLNQPATVLSNKDKYDTFALEDGENRDPNFSTPPNYKVKPWKDAIKSSAERKQDDNHMMRKEPTPKLKSTLSARNLFSGGDLLNKVAEFCNELKKLATGARDKDHQPDNMNRNVEQKQDGKSIKGGYSGYLNDKEKERKPLLDLSKEKSGVIETSGSKGKPRRKIRNDDTENTPICNNVQKTTPVTLDVKNSKRPEAGSLLQIRTCPPTPQGFSASGGPQKATPPKAFKSRRPQERGILQELNKPDVAAVNKVEMSSEVAEKEAARSLDVFWFLKPCTLSS